MATKLFGHRSLGCRLLANTALVGFAASSPAFAQTWTGGAGNPSWFDAANWSPSVVPSVLPVVINNGSTASPVVIDAAGAQSGGVKLGSVPGSVGALLVTGAGRITDTGTYFIVGDYGEGAVTVSNGGQVTTKHTVVANFPGATIGNVLVTGAGSQWTATELTVSYDANVGSFVVADHGKLEIVNPGGNAIVTLGRDSTTADGTLTVTGSGSSFVITNGVNFNIGSPGRGVFNVLDGASANTSAIVNINNKSEAHVTGTGSIWSAQGGITNFGTLTVTDGGTLASNGRVTVGATGTATIADGGTLTATQVDILGTATIGSGSTVLSSGSVSVGSASSGVLTISDGGVLRLPDPTQGLRIGSGIGTGGTLIIGAEAGQPAVAPGTVEATYVAFEGSANPGTRTLVFNHTSNNYVFAPYITGASGKGNVNVLAGTTTLAGGVGPFDGTIDISGGATLKIAANVSPNIVLPVDTKNDGTLFLNSADLFTRATGNISGTGNVVKTGSGWLTLTGQNSWTGGTEVQDGRLYIGELAGADPQDGTLVGDVLNNGVLLFRRKTDYTFGGVISGSGSFEKEGDGTLTLTGQSSYAGNTTVWSGSLALGADNRLPTATTLRLSGGTFDLNGHSQTVGNLGGFASGTLAIGTGALTTVTSVNTTLPSTITGTGDFIKQGAAPLTLTGTNSFSGTTTVDGGRMQVDGSMAASRFEVNSGATLGGSGSVGDTSIANGGTLEGRAAQVLTIASLDLNSGSKINVTLGAPSTSALFNVTGNLRLDGTLNVTDAGGFGQGVYRIIDYTGALTDNGMSVGAIPSGTSGTIQTATANQINLLVAGVVNDTQFWNGTTTVADGTIHGGSGTWIAGATNWTAVNGATASAWGSELAIFQNNPGTVTVDGSAGAISTTRMQFIGQGWTVSGSPITLNGAGGNTTIRVGDGTAGGSSDYATINSVLTGNSRLVKDDLGTLILAGDNTYNGGTAILNGTLQIGNGGTSGSITGNVANDGILAFNRSNATSFGSVISGSGAVGLMAGDLTLTADNSYTGGTDIAAGATLRLGNGGTTGSIVGNVNNGGTLVFNRSNDLTFGGVIGGAGNLRQIGSGKVELTGDSTAFTGATSIENGILAANGQLGGTLDVFSTGRLQGTGTVGDAIVSGTIAPGNSIGTINVGNISFNAGSIYEVEVNAAGQGDKIAASGTATINGGGVKVLAGMGNYAPATTYTILTAAGGRTGAFSDGVTSNLAFLDPSLSYDANNVYLTMTRNGTAFQNVGITPNQIATGGGVESLGLGNAVHDAVLNLSAPQAQYAFDQLSGEIHASARTAMIEDSRFIREATIDRIRAAFDGVGASKDRVVTYVDGKPVTVAPTADGLVLWGQGFGSWGNTNGDGNAAHLNRSTSGFFIGADAPIFDTWRFGAVTGYSRTTFDVKDRHSSGWSDNYHVGLYGGTAWGALALRTGAAYTWHDVTTSRGVSFPGFGDSLRGNYNAGTAQVFGELGHGFHAGNLAFEPFANLAYVSVHTDGFTENGGTAALTSPSATTDAIFTTLGLRASTTFDLNGTSLTAKGTLGWRHAFGDVTPLSTMRFAGGGDAFTIAGVPIARDAAVVEAGLDFAVSQTATFGLSYGGQFGSGVTDQSFRANFNVKF
jgi:outer membrane autotransporter protein